MSEGICSAVQGRSPREMNEGCGLRRVRGGAPGRTRWESAWRREWGGRWGCQRVSELPDSGEPGSVPSRAVAFQATGREPACAGARGALREEGGGGPETPGGHLGQTPSAPPRRPRCAEGRELVPWPELPDGGRPHQGRGRGASARVWRAFDVGLGFELRARCTSGWRC